MWKKVVEGNSHFKETTRQTYWQGKSDLDRKFNHRLFSCFVSCLIKINNRPRLLVSSCPLCGMLVLANNYFNYYLSFHLLYFIVEKSIKNSSIVQTTWPPLKPYYPSGPASFIARQWLIWTHKSAGESKEGLALLKAFDYKYIQDHFLLTKKKCIMSYGSHNFIKQSHEWIYPGKELLKCQNKGTHYLFM